MIVYIASPYSKGNAAANIRDSIFAAEEIIALGHVPYCPLLSHLWQLIRPHSVEFWYAYDKFLLERCDALVRLEGKSKGASGEVRLARKLGKLVFFGIEEFSEHLDDHEIVKAFIAPDEGSLQ